VFGPLHKDSCGFLGLAFGQVVTEIGQAVTHDNCTGSARERISELTGQL